MKPEVSVKVEVRECPYDGGGTARLGRRVGDLDDVGLTDGGHSQIFPELPQGEIVAHLGVAHRSSHKIP